MKSSPYRFPRHGKAHKCARLEEMVGGGVEFVFVPALGVFLDVGTDDFEAGFGGNDAFVVARLPGELRRDFEANMARGGSFKCTDEFAKRDGG